MKILPASAALAAALTVLLTTPSAADSLKRGALACLSENLLDQLTAAIVDSDQKAVRYLLQAGCMKTDKAAPVTVLNAGIFSGKSKVRAYAGGSSVELWVYTEDILDRDVREPQQGESPPSTRTMSKPVTHGKYLDPHRRIEHLVKRYKTRGDERGFTFHPQLYDQEDVLIDASKWIISNHYKAREVADAAHYFTDRDLMMVWEGKKFRVRMIPGAEGRVHGLLFEEQ